MSSPWPGAPASSPFPFSLPSAPSPATAFFSNLPAASPSLGTNPLLAQALLSTTTGVPGLGTGSTPAGMWGSSNLPSMANSPLLPIAGATPFGNVNSPLASFAAAQTPYPGGPPGSVGGVVGSGVGGAGVGSGTGTGAGGRMGRGMGAGNEVSIEDVIRGIDQAKLVLDQMETLLLQRQSLEMGVFGSKSEEGSGEGMEVDGAFEGDKQISGAQAQAGLLQAQSEYVQLLSAVTQLSNLSLFGGFPVPLSVASPSPDPSKAVTMAELTSWSEERAELEFSRREAVKAGSKAVLEVLRTNRQ